VPGWDKMAAGGVTMTLRDALLQEFDLEMPFTRRSIERVPMDKFAWKPHEKSMTLGWLATFSRWCRHGA
jgi:hypothetical protein